MKCWWLEKTLRIPWYLTWRSRKTVTVMGYSNLYLIHTNTISHHYNLKRKHCFNEHTIWIKVDLIMKIIPCNSNLKKLPTVIPASLPGFATENPLSQTRTERINKKGTLRNLMVLTMQTWAIIMGCVLLRKTQLSIMRNKLQLRTAEDNRKILII